MNVFKHITRVAGDNEGLHDVIDWAGDISWEAQETEEKEISGGYVHSLIRSFFVVDIYWNDRDKFYFFVKN